MSHNNWYVKVRWGNKLKALSLFGRKYKEKADPLLYFIAEVFFALTFEMLSIPLHNLIRFAMKQWYSCDFQVILRVLVSSI